MGGRAMLLRHRIVEVAKNVENATYPILVLLEEKSLSSLCCVLCQLKTMRINRVKGIPSQKNNSYV